MNRLTTFTIIIPTIFLFLTQCNLENNDDILGDNPSLHGARLTIQKNEGINVNESDAIWITGMKTVVNNRRIVKVHKMMLNTEKNYPVSTWDLVLDGPRAISGSGIRTYVSEDGLLMAKAGSGYVGLYLVDPNSGVKTIWEAQGFQSEGRAAPLAYRVIKGGNTYDYYGIAVKEVNNSFYRVYRFRKENGNLIALRPYRVNHPNIHQNVGAYTAYLDSCSTKDAGQCAPKFYAGRKNDFFGVSLTTDIPGTADDGQFITVRNINPPNYTFTSSSHATGGPVGTLNKEVYSMAGDDSGNWLMAYYPDTGSSNNFVSFDKVNQLVFHATRTTKLEPDGTISTSPKPALTVYKKECFSTQADCDPTAQPPAPIRSRIFRDVGLELGPTSDLGNGCVAVLSFKRPGEANGNTYFTKVYRACIRDPQNLDRGLTMNLLGEVEGAAYMYNDFTGATLFDRPIYILFDFSKRGFKDTTKVKYHWSPKIGFTNNAVGVLSYYRCYKSDAKPAGDSGFIPFILGLGIKQHTLPNCAGKGINQIEFKLERDPALTVRFSRFQNFSVTAEK